MNKKTPSPVNISFSKKEYATLVPALSMVGTIYALLGDMVDEKYKKKSDEIEAVESLVLRHAQEAGYSEEIYEGDGKLSLFSESKAYGRMGDDLDEFEEWSFYDKLATKLAWRDFSAAHSEKEIRAMAEERGGYLGVPLYDFEKRYYDEFATHDVDRLEVVDISHNSGHQDALLDKKPGP